MRCWDATSRTTLRRAVCSCSLALLAAVAWAGHFSDLAASLRATRSAHETITKVVDDRQAAADPDIADALADASEAKSAAEQRDLAERLKAMVGLRAMVEGGEPPQQDASRAKAIKASPLYRDPGVKEHANWLGQALARLRNINLGLTPPNVNPPMLGGVGPWVIALLWTLLGAGVLALAYFAARHINWKKGLGRKAKAVLEEDEPERTVDEWLEAADRLAAEGRYREAVRALYLACLLRFDEYRIARFDRHETNWEHLRRIQKSSQRPADLDFTAPTKAFDRIWYGRETEGLPDVEKFRRWYTETLAVIREAKV